MSDRQEFIPKVTYLAKEETLCPVCESAFKRELLMSGGGRLNAENVSELLHRSYKPSSKFGKITPLIYSYIICPNCFYASLSSDFLEVPENNREKLLNERTSRISFANKIAGIAVDFSAAKTLECGAAGYALVVKCYDYFPKKSCPTIKQAITSMRTAFLFEELNAGRPEENFNMISEMFYKKALFFYKRSIDLNQKKIEIMDNIPFLGPDIDKNYGFDSVLFLIGVLTYKFGDKADKDKRAKELDEGRLYLGKLFGMGKADFEKPKEILDKAKDFHKLMTDELTALDEKK